MRKFFKIREFISYAPEDIKAARRLYNDLKNAGLNPWLGKKNLLHGQNWKEAVSNAIKNSKYFIPLFSKSVGRSKSTQKRLEFALDFSQRSPSSFAIPVMLDEYDIPIREHRMSQYVDLSVNWEKGVEKISQAMKTGDGGKRSFNDWWNTVPSDLKDKARRADESNTPLLNQVNYVLLHLHLAGKHDVKPSHEELKDWLHSGQVDVLRMNKYVGQVHIKAAQSLPEPSQATASTIRRDWTPPSSARPPSKPPAKRQKNVFDRYPYAKFPEEVTLDKIGPLEVIIRVKKPQRGVKAITLTANLNETEIPVLAIVESSGFEVVGKYYATINVPVQAGDSNPVIFNLRAKNEGLQTIDIRFYQQETYVGEIKIESSVLASKPESPSSQITKQWKSADKLPDNIIQGPDITIYILEKRTSPDFEYDMIFQRKFQYKK